jgi:hypothetical protein
MTWGKVPVSFAESYESQSSSTALVTLIAGVEKTVSVSDDDVLPQKPSSLKPR